MALWEDNYRVYGARKLWVSSRLLFPRLCLPTGELPSAPTAYPPLGGRGIMMPTRRRTREQDRNRRIDAERALNDDRVAERNKPPPF